MKPNFIQKCGHLWRADFFSPKDFVVRAVFILVLFLIADLAGLREYTTFLSGTLPSATMSWSWVAFLGTFYLLLYFALILLVPILLLAAAFLAIWHHWRRPSTLA
jgi:hypothetical protein